jgi:hypothetical protein
MRISISPALRLLVAGALVASLTACDQQDSEASDKGPAERAGEQIDHALARVSEEFNKIAEQTGKNLQEMGKRLHQEAREARQAQRAQREQQERKENGERSSGE